jgi:hypothetical protein
VTFNLTKYEQFNHSQLAIVEYSLFGERIFRRIGYNLVDCLGDKEYSGVAKQTLIAWVLTTAITDH